MLNSLHCFSWWKIQGSTSTIRWKMAKRKIASCFRNFYNGGGVAIGDLNNDGLPDVYFTSNMGDDKLYLNKGDLKFEDITASSGIRQDGKWNTGVTFADINHDGWLDIYVCSSGHMGTGDRKNKLYINNHNLTFTESAAQYGLDISAYTTQVSFFDYDLDGDLDCFMINNSPIPVNQLDFANRRDLPEPAELPGRFGQGRPGARLTRTPTNCAATTSSRRAKETSSTRSETALASTTPATTPIGESTPISRPSRQRTLP